MAANHALRKPLAGLAALGVFAGLALASAAAAQTTPASAGAAAYARGQGAMALGVQAPIAADQAEALTAPGDEPSTLAAPAAAGGLDILSSADSDWTRSPTGEAQPLSVVPPAPQERRTIQTMNVSAKSGLNGGSSDAH